MLNKNDIKWACQAALLECISNHPHKDILKHFILKEATYEQLLNLCLNENTKEIMFESSSLELIASDLILTEADEETKKKYNWKKAVRHGALAGGTLGVLKGVKSVSDELKTPKGKSKLSYLWRTAASSNPHMSKSQRKIGVKMGIGAAKAATGIGKGIKGAAIGAAAGLTLYGLYRLLRRKGKSQEEAAAMVASKAKSPEDKKKWQKKARG